MTSYQVNFASHHTRDRHVGFLLFTRSGIGKYNKMSRFILFCFILFIYFFYLVLLNYNRVTRILAPTLGGNLNSFYEKN